MALSKRLPQRKMYQWLQSRGSPWLKSHVLWADRQVVVLNKPPNLLCQLGEHGRRNERGLVHLNTIFKDIKRWIHSSEPCTVHRLDKPTTGCLLVALNTAGGRSLAQQFVQGTVHKTYLALVHGGQTSFASKSGVIEEPIIYDDGWGRIGGEGNPSVTKWELLGSSTKAPLSLLRLRLMTGHKHQLRIHLAESLKAPILGDSIHGRMSTPSGLTNITNIPKKRLFLHASEISFYKYSVRGKQYRLGIRAPIPPDFESICRDVGIDQPYVNAAVTLQGKVALEEDLDRSLWDARESYDS